MPAVQGGHGCPRSQLAVSTNTNKTWLVISVSRRLAGSANNPWPYSCLFRTIRVIRVRGLHDGLLARTCPAAPPLPLRLRVKKRLRSKPIHRSRAFAFRARSAALTTGGRDGRVEVRRGSGKPPRFRTPLIEPDVRFSRIRLTDGHSRQTHTRGRH
jgi:hypothetical protein